MSCLTVIDTKKISDITTNSLKTGGINLISTEPIVEKGIVYSYVSIFPTIDHDKSIFPNKGLGKFDIALTGLSEGFTYFVRAYAINNKGDVAYGKTLEAKMKITTGGACSMLVTLLPGKIYNIPTGYELTGSNNNGSLVSSCIDTTKLEQLKLTCYGSQFIVDDGDAGGIVQPNWKINIYGFKINNIDYLFGAPLYFDCSGYATTADFQAAIASNPYLSTVIFDGCISRGGGGAISHGCLFTLFFKTVPNIASTGYVIGKYIDSDGYNVDLPIKQRADLPYPSSDCLTCV